MSRVQKLLGQLSKIVFIINEMDLLVHLQMPLSQYHFNILHCIIKAILDCYQTSTAKMKHRSLFKESDGHNKIPVLSQIYREYIEHLVQLMKWLFWNLNHLSTH